ncbi:MAG: hypothetical protein KBT34_10415 [Prevotella sp.]|nr:hypothetical protein [Candidatus Prevotella equi]
MNGDGGAQAGLRLKASERSSLISLENDVRKYTKNLTVNTEERSNSASSIQRHKYLDYLNEKYKNFEMTKLIGAKDGSDDVTRYKFRDRIKIVFIRKLNEHIFSDATSSTRTKVFDMPAMMHIPQLLKKSSYVKSAPDDKTKKEHQYIKQFHYFKTKYKGKTLYINVAEYRKGHTTRFGIYSFTDKIKA